MKKLFLLSLILPFMSLSAQPDSTITKQRKTWLNTSAQLMYQNGHVFATNEFLRGSNIEAEKIKYFQAAAFRFSTQTTGAKSWQQLYKYPYWGFGLYMASFDNEEEIGIPVAIYGFLNAPFVRGEKLSFNYELGLGLTFNWKSFDPITNKYNTSIGAGESVLLDAGLNLSYAIAEKLDLSTGFSLTHFSNGALKKPNLGLNTIAPRLSLKYNFNSPPAFEYHELQEFQGENEFLFSVYGGAKNVIFDTLNFDIVEKYEGVYFPEIGLSMGYNRQISNKSKFGFGFTFSYDGSVNAQVAIDENEIEPINGKFTDDIMLSIYPSYELVINNLSITLQPSFYLYRLKLAEQSPVAHQRIGFKYHFTNHLFAGVTLRAYQYHISDFIEWNLGYRILRP